MGTRITHTNTLSPLHQPIRAQDCLHVEMAEFPDHTQWYAYKDRQGHRAIDYIITTKMATTVW